MKKARVFSGIDRQELYHSCLNGKRIGLMTNQTGIDRIFRQSVICCIKITVYLPYWLLNMVLEAIYRREKSR